MDRFKIITKNKINNLPKTAGVYCFTEKKAETRSPLLYIGKAVNIRDRVKNHFQQPTYRDDLFIDKINKIGYFETGSEIEALILEANLIKKYQPKFNVVWRDDKNYFYVAIAENKNKIPYIFITHQPNSSSLRGATATKQSQKTNRLLRLQARNDKTEYIGPFTEGVALKKTLKFLRRVFPYYTSKHHSKNKCTWCHLDLCPGPYEQLIAPRPDGLGAPSALGEYKKNIKKLILILKGKRGAVLKSLKKEMKNFSKEKKFEKAGKTRDKIYALQQIMSHTKVINEANMVAFLPIGKNTTTSPWAKTQKILQSLLNVKKAVSKIECYDVSNIQGKQATGSMISAQGGPASGWVFDKSQYKKFRIKIEGKPNDTAMLKEVLERRLNHPEWPYPEIMLIDGGKAQLNAAIKTKKKPLTLSIRSYSQGEWFKGIKNIKDIKVMAIAKKNNELYIEGKDKPILLKTLPREIFNLILQLRDEAHRFAISYHKKLRKNYLLK